MACFCGYRALSRNYNFVLQAVAMQCRFLRMGAPNRLTTTGLLSRLIRIREELLTRKINDTAGAHVFTSATKSVDD